jgi:hypothetical protein
MMMLKGIIAGLRVKRSLTAISDGFCRVENPQNSFGVGDKTGIAKR